MSSLIKFKGQYFLLAIVIFIVEVLIALFMNDRFVRPYFGDFLVVILVYCFLRSFINITVTKAALIALVFSYFVETLQYLNVLMKLGLQNSKLAKTLLGSSFEWTDLLAYTLGIAFVLCLENRVGKKGSKRSPRTIG